MPITQEKLAKSPGLIFLARTLDLTNFPRVDSHLHTSWTDGEASVVEVHNEAIKNRLATVLFSEHSRKESADWFYKFAEEVRALPSSVCTAYVGTEVKVKSRNGDIDTTPSISSLCDFIMASVHRFIDKNDTTVQFAETDPADAVRLEYELTKAALRNPEVDILGHVFGMSYRRFKVTPPDDLIRELIFLAAENSVAVEINSHYHPKPFEMIQWCREAEAYVTFGSNAHSLADVGAITHMLNRDK
jgi:histidinol phosphatase-like PHP family hydrolase